jgi:plastocyanin
VATTKVSMAKSYRFDPKTIEIKADDTVTSAAATSVAIKFDKPGSYHYVCTLHSKDMDGTVVVT